MKIKSAAILLIIILAAGAFHFTPPRPQMSTPGSWSGSDLSYVSFFISGWNNSEITNPYNYSEQLVYFRKKTSYRGEIIMPFAWSPASLFIFSPFTDLFTTEMRKAELVFNLSAIFLLSCSIFFAIPKIEKNNNLIFLSLLCLILFCSNSIEWNLELCQTGIFGLALLLLIPSLETFKVRLNNAVYILISVCILLLCSIKVTYLTLALCLLLIHKNFKSLIMFAVLISAFLVCFHSTLSPELWINWYQSVSFFNYPDFEKYKSAGTMKVYEQSAVFRTLLSTFTPEGLARKCGAILSGLAAFSMLAISYQSKSRNDFPGIIRNVVIIFSAFLLFSSYLGFHDEVLILVPLLYLAMFQDIKLKDQIPILMCLIIILNFQTLTFVRLFSKLILLITCHKAAQSMKKHSTA